MIFLRGGEGPERVRFKLRRYRKEPFLVSTKTILVTVVWSAILAADPLFGQAPGTAYPGLSDHGTFEILTGGKKSGTEKFAIITGTDTVEAHGEIHLRTQYEGKTIEVRSQPNLVLDPQLHPLQYTWNQKGSQSSQLTIDFRPTLAHVRYKTVKGEDDQRDFQLGTDVVVLDDNVLHHYQLVVVRYDQTTGGKQDFHAFVPQEAVPGVISVEQLGTESLIVEGAALNLRHLVLATELARIDLWVDQQDHLQAVAVPGAEFRAYRKK